MTKHGNQASSRWSWVGRSVFRHAALVLVVAGLPGPLYSADLLHQYDFNGNLADTLPTSVSLEQHGNIATSVYGGDGWSWTATTDPGGGLKLETALLSNPQSYSLGFRVKYGNVTGYRKIISFKGTADDDGLYFLNGNLVFYPFGANVSITYTVDTVYDFIFSRSSDDVIRVYTVDGNGTATKVYEENDPTDASVPVAAAGKYQFLFFCDDTDTSTEWTDSGAVQRIRVWNGPLEEGEVGAALSEQDPTVDESAENEPQATTPCINWPLSLWFRFPVCGLGCLTAMAATLVGLAGMKCGVRRRTRKPSAVRKH